MTTQKTSTSSHITTLLAIGVLILAPFAARSASIIWDPIQTITSASDVSTAGTLIGAFNVGSLGVPATTVNGVPFQSFAAPGGNGVGTGGGVAFTMTGSGGVFESNTDGGSSLTPFSLLDPAYQILLSSFIVPLFSPATLAMTGLLIGTQYQFQFWSNKSSDSNGFGITATSGNSVILHSNHTNVEGGLGEWVVGRFTADAPGQLITFIGDGDGGFLNAFQLRTAPTITNGVPDTGNTLALLGCAVIGLAFAERRLRARV